jgi:hypothetical protein
LFPFTIQLLHNQGSAEQWLETTAMEVDTFPKQNDSVSIEPCHDNDNYSQTIVTLKQLKISPITHNPKSLIACYLTKQKQYLTNRINLKRII